MLSISTQRREGILPYSPNNFVRFPVRKAELFRKTSAVRSILRVVVVELNFYKCVPQERCMLRGVIAFRCEVLTV